MSSDDVFDQSSCGTWSDLGHYGIKVSRRVAMRKAIRPQSCFKRLGEFEKQLKSEGDKEAREHLGRADTLYFITEKMQARSNKDV
jgi:hypothetical protein